ncbi:hypothetical protein [Mesorhizobium retamae]|uniref:Uncharacterized protein n=1 Tax=Mesorhizobium retamae TaxID=2912854 RepID=A0ABS9QI64_9HYPH|nr:hypothetical protein [Mesorhizobium sp. IRAMC:0171]MCG7507095.1 hypothetical protein [Mesorhizobium sp. IRAMC:0171]
MANPKAYATQFTRTGKLNMTNRKPYRSASQTQAARATASKGDDGAYHSSAPVSYHSAGRKREA